MRVSEFADQYRIDRAIAYSASFLTETRTVKKCRDIPEEELRNAVIEEIELRIRHLDEKKKDLLKELEKVSPRVLKESIDELELNARTYNSLCRSGKCKNIGDALELYRTRKMFKIRNFGGRCAQDLQEALIKKGLIEVYDGDVIPGQIDMTDYIREAANV